MNTRDSIRAAMERLLAGTPEHTDGRLTKTNLAYEAGVGRATLYRQHDLTAEWIRRAAAADPTEAPQSNPAVIARLTRQLAEERARRCESDRIAQGLAFVVAELYRQLETLTDDSDQQVIELAATAPRRRSPAGTRKRPQ